LCISLEELANSTWTHFNYAIKRRMRLPDERAFSEHHSVELAVRHPDIVEVTLVSGAREAETGADLELWVGDGAYFLPLLVQAKKLALTGKYETLDRRIGKGGCRGFQLDILIAACERGGLYAGFVPLVLTFNGRIPGLGVPTDRCKNSSIAEEQRGCSVAAAREARAAVSRRGAWEKAWDSIGPLSWPWQCLFCCPGTESTLPIQERFAAMLSGTQSADGGAWISGSGDDAMRLWSADEIPGYVARMSMERQARAHREDERAPAARRVMLIQQPGPK
jgi:hypothetical protein